jgi:hypothetical protein
MSLVGENLRGTAVTLPSLTPLLDQIEAVIRSHAKFARACTARGSSSAPRPGPTISIEALACIIESTIWTPGTRKISQDLAY